MAHTSPSQRPARTPRPSLKERLLAARTELTIEKSSKRAANEHPADPAASKKRKIEPPAGQVVEEQEEPAASQSDEAEASTNHDLVSSDHDDEDLDAPEEHPHLEEKDYDTEDDLYYASDSDGELEEKIQSFHYEHAMVWRIEDAKKKSPCESVSTTIPSQRLFAPLDAF